MLGLECSRLARNNADWQRLLQICAHNDTLILDEDGLYDPTSFNDRALLGLKGQMSEFELHFLRARLRGGILAKARRGELKLQLPIGLVYDLRDQVTLDPDAGVRGALSLLFETFAATGSAFAVVKTFRDQQLLFPGRHRSGPHAGELYWNSLCHDQVLKVLHNPAYAGAYVYGRARHTTDLDGRPHTLAKPPGEWTVLIHDHHPGYLTWPQYQANQQTLAANAAAHGHNRKAGPAREGPALLQGLIICGRCGRRMTVRYHCRNDGTTVPDYVCQHDGIQNAAPICQHMPGAIIDAAVADLLLATLTPLALEVAMSVSDELIQHAQHADSLRAASVQRAQHAADQARRRYLAVDPGNRLVADALEADWNARLRELADAQDHYTAAKTAAAALDEQQRARIRALAADLPALWNDPATPARERKRLLRLLVSDVTLTRGQDTITAAIRFPGGGHHVLHLPVPLNAWQLRKTPDEVITLIDQLLEHHTYAQIAGTLNTQQGTPRRPHRTLDRRARRQIQPRTRPPQPPPAAARPRPAHPRRDRPPAPRAHPEHQTLAPARPDHRRAGRRPRRLPLPPGPDPAHPHPGQASRPAARRPPPVRPPQPPPRLRPPANPQKCHHPMPGSHQPASPAGHPRRILRNAPRRCSVKPDRYRRGRAGRGRIAGSRPRGPASLWRGRGVSAAVSPCGRR